jgi:alpha-methylacyl-CoA racemase
MGPLANIKIIELAAIGPVPFAMALLADLGATIIRVDRREPADLGLPRHDPKFDVLGRGRRSIALDLKSPAGRNIVLRLVKDADGLVEGFRPGVLERLDLAPQSLLAANPRLVIGRMTGFGQTGPHADRAGHDINYIAMTGVLDSIGRAGESPVPPLNLVGDYGGGGMFLAIGMLAAIHAARSSGKGQVVDAAMIDGASYLMAMFHGLSSERRWNEERGTNILDGGAPWYDVYRTKDDRWLAVGAIEARFYAELLRGLGLSNAGLPAQHDREGWPTLRARFSSVIATKTRDEWDAVFAGTDACVTPVLTLREARHHPHMRSRNVLIERDGVVEPSPAPRFSVTETRINSQARPVGSDTHDILRDLGMTAAEIEALEKSGAIASAPNL